MQSIPIAFDYQGKRYEATFREVAGAAGRSWHLMIDGYYRGQLNFSESLGFQFTSQSGKFKELTDFFASVITAWYE